MTGTSTTGETARPLTDERGASQDHERLMLVADAVAGAVYDWDLLHGRVERPAGLLAVLGFDDATRDEVDPDADWWIARVHPEDAARLASEIERRIADPLVTTSALEYRMRHRDGSWIWVSDRGRLVRDERGRAVRMVGIVVAVDSSRQADARAERTARMRAEALQHVASALGRARDVTSVAHTIVEHMVGALAACGGGIMQLAPDGRELVMLAAMGYDADVLRRFSRVPVTMPIPASDVARDGQPRFIDSMAEWRARYGREPAALPNGSVHGAWAALPLRADERLIGVLTIAFDQPRPFADDDRAFMQAFADQCAQALERADAGEAERAARLAVERTMHARQESERALRETQRVARIGSWRWDVATDRLAWDDAICALYGIAPEEAPHDLEGYLARVHPDDRERARAFAARAFETHEPFAFDHRIVLPDGGVRVLHGRGAAVLDAAGRLVGMIGSSQDVTERKHTEAELARLLASERAARGEAEAARAAAEEARSAAEEARSAAEAANRAKSDFLAVMSHELRTPLNAIQGHLQLLEMGVHGPVTGAQEDAMQRIDRAQRHLLRLIEGVLNFAKLEAGHIGFRVEPVLVREVVRDVLPLVEPQLAARGLTLQVRLPGDDASDGVDPVPVRADREKLGQVLLNLLGNAAKFTPAGGHIEVRLDVGAPGTPYVRLQVSDTGIGIPQEKLESIFEPFVQVDSTLTRENGGTGLGLAISRELVRGMGGDIAVESRPGAGSTFTVRLPRA